MSNNYIVINGKKADLTTEQLRQLGIEVELERKSPFGKLTDNGYYYIANTDVINFTQNINSIVDEDMYNNANYFNNQSFVNQVMLHQQLYRKLLKYAYDNNGEVTEEDWKCTGGKYLIYYNHVFNRFDVQPKQFNQPIGCVYFKCSKVAEQAIKDVVEPFMEEHPEFVW